MDMLSSLLAFTFLSLITAISPGPDFFIVLKNSLSYSRKIGFMTAVGVSLGLLIHLGYTMVGIGVLISESALLYNVIKYVGVSYLFYIGLTGLLSTFKKEGGMQLQHVQETVCISSKTALKQGFLTNLLNPKAAIFFISLFSQFIDADTPLWLRIEYAAINWSIVLGWFMLLAYVTTGKALMAKVDRFRLTIDRAMGVALMLLSMKLLLI